MNSAVRSIVPASPPLCLCSLGWGTTHRTGNRGRRCFGCHTEWWSCVVTGWPGWSKRKVIRIAAVWHTLLLTLFSCDSSTYRLGHRTTERTNLVWASVGHRSIVLGFVDGERGLRRVCSAVWVSYCQTDTKGRWRCIYGTTIDMCAAEIKIFLPKFHRRCFFFSFFSDSSRIFCQENIHLYHK